MESKNTVIIIARHFLTRLGIKTFISILGTEPDVVEVSSPDVISAHANFSGKIFIIVEQNSLGSPSILQLNKLAEKLPACRILLLAEKPIDHPQCKHFILESHTQKDILDTFQHFFFDWEDKEEKENHDILLSEREIDVLKLVALGGANKEIADKLNISVHTVISHRKNITEKLGIKTIAGLTVYAVMNNLIVPEELK